MRFNKKINIAFCALALIIFSDSCNNNNSDENRSANTAGLKTDSPVTAHPATDTLHKTSSASSNQTAGKEKTDIPVYGVWISKKNNGRSYDGLYDSATSYIRLCESKQEIHIDDPSEISLNPDSKCYNQGLNLEMITIKRDSGVPLFIHVLHVDSIGRKLVGLTDNNDTITTSISTMNNAAFEKLKMEYRASPFSPAEVNKMKQYYSPQMEIKNLQRKEQVMKMNVVIKK